VFETIQRGVQRPLLNLEGSTGDLLDAQQDAVAVQLAEGNGFENEDVERPREQVGGMSHSFSYVA
jgi:hypothetical protein